MVVDLPAERPSPSPFIPPFPCSSSRPSPPLFPQEDILKVVVDLPVERQRRVAEGLPKGLSSDYDTGKFECIADGFKEVKTPAFSGLKLELQVCG